MHLTFVDLCEAGSVEFVSKPYVGMQRAFKVLQVSNRHDMCSFRHLYAQKGF